MAQRPPKTPKTSEFKRATDTAFEEVYNQVPESVVKTGKTGKARTEMMRAIAISKAREAIRRK